MEYWEWRNKYDIETGVDNNFVDEKIVISDEV